MGAKSRSLSATHHLLTYLICITERTQTHKRTHHSKETSPHHSLLFSQAEDVVSLLCVFVDFWQLLTESSDCPHVADSLLCQLHTNVILLGLHWLKIKLSTSKFTLSAYLIKLPKEVKHLYYMYTKLRIYCTTHFVILTAFKATLNYIHHT